VRPDAEARIAALPGDLLVLDVGGWARPLARADWVIDLLPHATRGLYGGRPEGERFSAATWVEADVCEPWPFADGQFDVAICGHTLEDVRDPVLVCRELARVARSGYVEVPHAAEELTWGVHGPWVGWSHHRWVVEREGDGLVFTHKPHLLCAPGRHLPADTPRPEPLGLWWERALPAREQVHVGAETFDPWLEGLLAAHRPPARRRRPWTR
jgi:hypothetical protein